MGQGIFLTVVTVVIALALAAAYKAVLRNSPLDDPQPLYLPRPPRPEGAYAPNKILHKAKKVGAGKLPLPEEIVADNEGRLYVSCSDGWIKRVWPFEDKVENWTHVEGRVLGLAFGNNGELIACEALNGLGLLNVTEKGYTVLTDEADGVKFKLTDAVAVADDGQIYFTDASSKFNLANYALDQLEGRPNGRLLQYNPADGSTKVLMKDLHFANGVALSAKQDFLVVAETTLMRLHKYWLEGDKKGKSEIFLDNLPGFPDNVHATGHGTFLVGLVGEGSWTGALVLRTPFLKHLLALAPWLMDASVPAFKLGNILEVSGDGQPLKLYGDSTGEFITFTTVGSQVGEYLYVGGLNSDYIGQLSITS